MNPYNMNIKEILESLKTNETGLSTQEAKKRINIYGENVIEEAKGKSKIKRFLDQFNDMMIIILIIVAIIMAIYGFLVTHEYTDTIVIAVVVLINAFMGFIQEEKAEVTLEGLKKYTTSTVKVKRDGKITIVDSKDIVPGDIIVLEAGDRVPADARIINESNLSVDESPLTGESVPVKKQTKVISGDLQIQDRFNMIFCGCNITNGRCEAVVTKTGMLTELGSIAVSLNTPYEVMTPLQIKISEISKKITILIFIILVVIFLYGVLNGYKLMEIIMLCVSLAVAAIPEGLPAVITIALSGGTSALAKKKTVVRQMNAVETLGSTDIICSDKTGTITQNKMKVKKTIIYNDKIFEMIAALANDTMIEEDKYYGDPTETCLFDYLKNKHLDPIIIREHHPRIIDAPFDSERKMMSSVNEIDGKKYILVKGSLDSIISNCDYIDNRGKKIKLTKDLKQEILVDEESLAKEALRVIAFAYKELKEDLKSSAEVFKEEKSLIYVGMVGIIDPPRESVVDSVKKCKKAGIRPIMITGDSLITACAIAREVGIIEADSEGTLGSELDKYTDEELVNVVKKYNVYARVSPEHKRRIIAAWQSNKKVVAMTGDGVNDAPAIKDAHVGIGMGITGTEVTKSVADVILLDDSFSTIVVAVEEGRRIFTNIRNNIVYSLSSNFAEIFAVLIGIFTGHTILLPIHILFIDLITDSIPSICLSFEPSEKNIMDKNPRGIDKPLFTPFIKACIVSSAIIETTFVLITYFYALNHYNQEIAATYALFALVIQEIVYAFVCRNLKELIYKQGLLANKQLNFGILILLVIEAIVFLTPLGKFISVETLEIIEILKILIFNVLVFFIYEILKPILRRVFKD